MAIVTQRNMAKHRGRLAKGRTVSYLRVDFDLALQAVVDVLLRASTRTALNNAIEGVSANKFTAPEKKLIVAFAFDEVFGQEK